VFTGSNVQDPENVDDVQYVVGVEVMTAVVMDVAIFWDTAPCIPVVNRRIGEFCIAICWLLSRLIFYPEDGGNMLLRNIIAHKDYTALYPRIWQHSFSIIICFETSSVTIRQYGIK
jgi:hypothetical protein